MAHVTDLLYTAVTIAALIGGIAFGLFLEKYISKNRVESAKELVKKMEKEAIKDIERRKTQLKLESQEELNKLKKSLENKHNESQLNLQRLERKILQRESVLEHKSELIDKRERSIYQKEDEIAALKNSLLKERESIKQELYRVANLSSEEAKEIVLKEAETDSRFEAAKIVNQIIQEANATANEKASEIIATTIQKLATEYVQTATISVVPLPSEEVKGRIIGREGRNIRAFETLTGVDLLIDDTPEAVTLSAFNPVRREVAKLALERLIADGRIHPAHIEKFVEEVEKEIETQVFKEGEKVLIELGIPGVSEEIMKLLGKLRYRTSYGQSVLSHSIEVAYIASSIASELKLDYQLTKRAGLFHDIGKALDHEIEGPHALIGADILRKNGEREDLIHAVAAHHNDVPIETVLDTIVHVSDAISAARPGARRESLELYIKRLEKLEEIASSIPGIKSAFAIQAGRELRVMVSPEEINEETASKIAIEVTKKIEREVSYPGQIKVTVVRETRYIEYAK